MVKTFRSAREAKEFLISRIVLEAQRESVSLTETERKMLYFSESGATLPDIENVNEDFNSQYDQDDYEAKIAALVKHTYRSICKEQGNDYDKWWSAVRLLGTQDHYILVIISQVRLRPRGDQLKLLGAGLGIVILLLFIMFPAHSVIQKYGIGHYLPSDEATGFYIWVGALCFAIGSLLLGWIKKNSGLGRFLLGLSSKKSVRLDDHEKDRNR